MKNTFSIAALSVLLCSIPALAQNGPPGGGGGPGGPPDFAQMRERMMDQVKDDMGVTDDQWKALEPKIEKVDSLRRDTEARRGPWGGDEDESAVQTATQELRDVLENNDAKPDQIQAKLDALRKAKTAAKAELEKARKDLADGLTVKQLAVLVSRGLLD